METRFGVGVVGEYDASTRIYRVQLDAAGDVLARAIVSGADRPYPQFSRVVLIRVLGAEWLVLGEIAMSSQGQEPVADRKVDEFVADEVVADFNRQARAARDAITADTLPPFRPVNEGPRFVGDAVLENRTTDPKLRSFLRVYAFGSILASASRMCFTFWDKTQNLILQQSRDLIVRCIGHLYSITTDLTKKTTTKSETLSGRPGVVDIDRTEGFIPAVMRGGDLMLQPTAEYGARAKYRQFLVDEVDTDGQVIRRRVDMDTVPLSESWEGSLADVGGDQGKVVQYGDWLTITIDAGAKTASIVDLEHDQSIVLTPASVALQRGQQSVALTDDEILLSGASVTIQASRTLTLAAPNVKVITNG